MSTYLILNIIKESMKVLTEIVLQIEFDTKILDQGKHKKWVQIYFSQEYIIKESSWYFF